jgi:hypothetical protein
MVYQGMKKEFLYKLGGGEDIWPISFFFFKKKIK